MYERFTGLAKQVMQLAAYDAHRVGKSQIYTDNLLVALNHRVAGRSRGVLSGLGVQPKREPDSEARFGGDMKPSETTQRVIEAAEMFADSLGDAHVCTEHLLVGLVRTRGLDQTYRGEGRSVTGREIEDEVKRVLSEDVSEPVDDRKECHSGECDDTCGLVDPKAADGYEVVSAYLNRTVDELRAEVKAEKDLNRKLWVIIAHLRQATGIGWGVIESGHPAWDGFNDKCRTANKLLDGIVPLAPAGDSNAG